MWVVAGLLDGVCGNSVLSVQYFCKHGGSFQIRASPEGEPGGVYPFRPLVAMPSMKYRCRQKNTMETGTREQREAAMIRW